MPRDYRPTDPTASVRRELMDSRGFRTSSAVIDLPSSAVTRIEPSRAAWAERIRSQWHQTVTGIVAVGAMLLEAKAELQHGEFLLMVANDLRWSPRMTQFLMTIARNKVLSDAKHVSHLPSSWSVLATLAKVDDSKLEEAIATGVVSPDMSRAAAARLAPTPARKPAKRSAAPLHKYMPKKDWPTARSIVENVAESKVYILNGWQLRHLRNADPSLAPALDAFDAAVHEANEIMAKAGERLVAAAATASTTPIPWPPKPEAGE